MQYRYAAFSPAKTAGRHRLYRERDVIKARLLRQLAASGRGIGSIAHLSLQQLQQLLGASLQTTAQAAPPSTRRRVSAVIVGDAIAARVNAPEWRHRDPDAVLHVRRVFVDLAEAAADVEPLQTGSGEETGLLLVRLNTVNARTCEQLMTAVARQGVQRAIVLYNYGPQALTDSLRSAGLTVRREPVPDAELAELIHAVVAQEAATAVPIAAAASGLAIPRRRYSDATLAHVVMSRSTVACECPRHLAEIIGQLVSFEEYSEQCLNDTGEDAQLHAYLRSVSGSARVMFEQALQRASLHGGVSLPEEHAPA